MKERLPNVCLVRFAGLFTYHVGAVAAPGDCLPNPNRSNNQVTATSGRASRPALVPRRSRIALENLERQNERLCVTGPTAGSIAPARTGRRAIVNATIQVTAVVPLPKTQTCPGSDGINPTRKIRRPPSLIAIGPDQSACRKT